MKHVTYIKWFGFWLGDYQCDPMTSHISIHLSLTLWYYAIKIIMCSVCLLTEMYICHESLPAVSKQNFYNESQLGFV